jgi:TolA-binding protein/thiol-disulfide isomerase/thioredoxin
MIRRLIRSSLVALLALVSVGLVVSPVSAVQGPDIPRIVQDYLNRDGVRMVVLDFFTTNCPPCEKAKPYWRKMVKKYRSQGLRFVVSPSNVDGVCANVGWNPDKTTACDYEGDVAKAFGVVGYPSAFAWSWDGTMLVQNESDVTKVEKLVQEALLKLPRVVLQNGGNTRAEKKKMEPLLTLLEAELSRTGKLDVQNDPSQARALNKLMKESYNPKYAESSQCEMGTQLAPNSILRVNVIRAGRSDRLVLNLLPTTKACRKQVLTVPYNAARPEQSIKDATQELISRLKRPLQMPTSGRSVSKRTIKERTIDSAPKVRWRPEEGSDEKVFVKFRSTPPGATILVDGQTICSNNPRCQKRLRLGEVRVEMKLPRYKPRTERVRITKKETLNWDLAEDFALLTVKTKPPGLNIKLDGKVMTTPLLNHELPSGPTLVELADACHEGQARQLNLKGGGRPNITLTSPGTKRAAVMVVAKDEDGNDVDAEVVVGGRGGSKVGNTFETLEVDLCPGTLSLRSQDYGSWSIDLTKHGLVERATTEIRATLGAARRRGDASSLRKPRAVTAKSSDWKTQGLDLKVVSFTSTPPKALVEVDGQAVCKTPCSRALTPGAHTVAMSRALHVRETKTIRVKDAMQVPMMLEEDFGTLEVKSTPEGLSVWLDGEEQRGRTPLTLTRIPSGEHEIAIKSPCHHEKGMEFTLERGKTKTMVLSPSQRLSAVQVDVTDQDGNDLDEVEIYIDGKRAGEAFEKITTSLCAQSIEVRHAKHGRWSQRLALTERKTLRLKTKLGAQRAVAKKEPVNSRPSKPLQSLVGESSKTDVAPATGAGKRSPHTAYSLESFELSLFGKRARAIQARMTVIRQKKIRALEGIIKSNRPYKNKADVLFRLAEAHWSESKYKYMLSRDDYDKAMECYDEKRCTQEPAEPAEDFSQSLDYYRQVLRNFPMYRRIDEVMYYLGRAALRTGKTRKDIQLQKEGVKYLGHLVRLHPKSRFIAQTYLSLGEYFFETEKLSSAKNAYEKIVFNFQRSSMFNYALYKLGWVYFNLAEFEKTVKTFQQVVASISKDANRARIEFRSQALNDLIVTWAEIDGGWMAARQYFLKEVGQVGTYKKLEKMAGLLVGRDKDDEALALYNHLIDHDKVSPQIVKYFDAMMDLRQKVGSLADSEKEINRMTKYFDKNGSWRSANKMNRHAVNGSDNLVATFLHYLANSYHVEAQKKEKQHQGSKAAYTKAGHYYKMFLDRFPNHKRAYTLNFYYAEILFHDLKDYGAAAVQYEAVINKDRKGKYLADSAEGVVYCLYRLMVQEGLREAGSENVVLAKRQNRTGLNAPALRPIPRTALHNLEQRYITAADNYVALLKNALGSRAFRKKNPKKGAKIPDMMYIAAQTFYRHGHFANVVRRLMVIFDLYPKHKYASIAVNDIIDVYIRLKHWDKIEAWARQLIRTRNFEVKTQPELEGVIAYSKNYQAVDFMKERNYDEAIRVQQELVNEFGKKNKPLAAKALFNIAIVYETERRFPEAVQTFEQVAKRYPKQQVAAESLLELAAIHKANNRSGQAIKVLNRLVKRYRKQGGAVLFKAHKRLATHYEDANKRRKACALLKKMKALTNLTMEQKESAHSKRQELCAR